ncbi:VanZ family protein [Salipaludibacillus sp. CUR1]|uniref:VanZ family protein n=1 Tax=Salipaludibacillus sp. CUR1 TaxID=2820003 RepID=UPI001E4A94A1|nr:VanZ family protein [Salipaludibacillus sp. CUR1]MCE7791218.1 VanZ family protein [Salipaludibacillus sp. CUR1]
MKSNRKKKAIIIPATWLIAAVFIIYLAGVFYVTLFAWNYGSSYGPVGPGGRNYNLEPFLSIYRIAVYSPDMTGPLRILAGNVLLFVPFGILFPYLAKRILGTHSILVGLLTVLTAMLLSVTIEILQFIFTYRVANIDDVILNTLGGLAGYIIYRFSRLIKLIS